MYNLCKIIAYVIAYLLACLRYLENYHSPTLYLNKRRADCSLHKIKTFAWECVNQGSFCESERESREHTFRIKGTFNSCQALQVNKCSWNISQAVQSFYRNTVLKTLPDH